MGFSGFFHFHTRGMAAGKFAISCALRSKKPKKHSKPPNRITEHPTATRTQPVTLDAGPCSNTWTSEVNHPATDMQITPDKKCIIGRNRSAGLI
jgi:hypothetical protein